METSSTPPHPTPAPRWYSEGLDLFFPSLNSCSCLLMAISRLPRQRLVEFALRAYLFGGTPGTTCWLRFHLLGDFTKDAECYILPRSDARSSFKSCRPPKRLLQTLAESLIPRALRPS